MRNHFRQIAGPSSRFAGSDLSLCLYGLEIPVARSVSVLGRSGSPLAADQDRTETRACFAATYG